MTSETSGRGRTAVVDYIVVGARAGGLRGRCATRAVRARRERRADRGGAGESLAPVGRSARHRRPGAVSARSATTPTRPTPQAGLGRAQGLPAARPRPRRLEPDQRDDLHARPAAGLRRPGRRSAARAGAGRTCCPTSSAPRTTRAAPTPGTASAGPLHVSDLSYRNPGGRGLRRGRRAGADSRATPISTARPRKASGAYQLFQKNGRRYNAARAYLEAAPPPNLAVYPEMPGAAHRVRGPARRRRRLSARRPRGAARRPARGDPLRRRLRLAATPDGFGRRTRARRSERFGIEVVHDAPDVGANLQDHCDYAANLIARGPGLFGLRLGRC